VTTWSCLGAGAAAFAEADGCYSDDVAVSAAADSTRLLQ